MEPDYEMVSQGDGNTTYRFKPTGQYFIVASGPEAEKTIEAILAMLRKAHQAQEAANGPPQ